MKYAYVYKKFRDSTLCVISQINSIIEEYQKDGMSLTLRQLYYQFVSRGYIPNDQSEYNRLGTILSNARLAGYVDWHAIEDRTRKVIKPSFWRNPGHIMSVVADAYRLDRWRDQEFHVEVWVEKEALVGVIATICEDLDVSYFACKGYVSQSEQWRSGKRFENKINEGKVIVVVHLGDHDPSGIDMTRDNRERLSLFSGFDIKVERIALNMDQVEQYKPPPNPAKLKDTRASDYIEKFGYESWELDALEPRVLRSLIEETVLKYRDEDIYNKVLDEEEQHIAILNNVKENWRNL